MNPYESWEFEMGYRPIKLPQQRHNFDFADQYALEWCSTNIDEQGRPQKFVLTDETISGRLHQNIPPIYADAVDVAAAVHLADRRALRGPENRGWSRDLRLKVPVRCLDVWQSSPVRDALFAVLKFATQDNWELEFTRHSGAVRCSETQEHLLLGSGDEPCEVSLYSGGLDSYAGLVAACIARSDVRHVCVSVTGNPRHIQRQRDQLDLVQRAFGVKITHIPVGYQLKGAEVQRQERTRRSRGFLFLVIGAVTALIAGKDELLLDENGVGAINLPQDGSQIGIDLSRSVHPNTLALVSRLVSLLSEQRFSVRNRCIYLTKTEMCSHPSLLLAANGIRSTFSCDGFPVRRSRFAQCGFCTSCILRRQALEAAHMSIHDSGDYGRDLTLDQPLLAHHLRGLRAMDLQVTRMDEATRSVDPWKSLTLAFPELRRAAEILSADGSAGEVRGKLLRMYKRHVADWREFSAIQRLEDRAMLRVA